LKSIFAALTFGLMAFSVESAVGEDIDMTAKSCTADAGADRAFCVTMIGGTREELRQGGSTVCSPNGPNDLSDTYAVIDFIRAHPERQAEEIGAITQEVLQKLHPCP
jgi:hypothetical protein